MTYTSGQTMQSLLDYANSEMSHQEKFPQMADMWEQMTQYLFAAETSLKTAARSLERDWTDGAYHEFRGRVDASAEQVSISARRLQGLAGPANMGPGFDESVMAAMRAMPQHIRTAHTAVVLECNRYQTDCNNARANDKPAPKESEYVARAGRALDSLAARYSGMKGLILDVQEQKWHGPLAPLPESPDQGIPGPAPGPASTSTPDPNSPGEVPDPNTTPDPNQNPTTPSNPNNQNPTTTDLLQKALEAATKVPDALSALSQLAQQAGGAGTVPQPLSAFDQSTLDSLRHQLDPYQRALFDDALRSGSPTLAGLAGGGGGAGGGGLPGGGGLGATQVTALSGPGGPMSGSAPFTGWASTASTTTAGTAAPSGAPPMMPPQSPGQNGKGSGGIKPGDAEHPTGRTRDRKVTGTPGVALTGRSGRGAPGRRAATQAPTPQRRWDTENTTVHLLDEELWQVEQDDQAHHRRGHQGGTNARG